MSEIYTIDGSKLLFNDPGDPYFDQAETAKILAQKVADAFRGCKRT